MTREELLALQDKKVAITTEVSGSKIAYHGVIMKVSEKGVVLGMGNLKIPTPVLIENITVCVEFKNQDTYVKGHRA